MAEAQVARLATGAVEGKSTIITVKSADAAGKKRKADEDAGAAKDKEKKGARRSMKKAKR